MKHRGHYLLAILFCTAFVAIGYAENPSGGSASTVPMPETRILDSLTDLFEPVTFDHSMHTEFADACAQCHHQHGESAECRQCHSLKASDFKKTVVTSFTPCKDCHSTFDPTHPGMPGLKGAFHRTCFECHRGVGLVGLDPKGCTASCHSKKEQKASR